MFDAKKFMSTVTKGASSVQRTICPAGEWEAVIDPESLDVKSFDYKDGSGSGYYLVHKWIVQDSKALAGTDLAKFTINGRFISLDIDEKQGKLEEGDGKNVALGYLRTALKMNDSGKDFSLAMLGGKRCKVCVQHVESKAAGAPPGTMAAEIKYEVPL